MVQVSFLGYIFKSLDPVVGVILLGLTFLRRGLAQLLADRPEAETSVGVKLDPYFFYKF